MRMVHPKDKPAEQTLARAYEGVCAALIAERSRSQALADTLELVREYAPMSLHEHMADKTTISQLQQERIDLRATIYERDETIKDLRSQLRKPPSVGGE